MKSNEEFIRSFSSIGNHFILEGGLFDTMQTFVCQLYGIKKCCNVDEARYLKFCSRKKTPEPQQLPPTQDVLLCHLKCVNYATAVIIRALLPNPNVLTPDGYGWYLEDDILQVQWMLRKPIPDDLLEFISCRYQTSSCSNKKCICVAHGLNCTDLCTCSNCDNQEYNSESEDDSDNEFESSSYSSEGDDFSDYSEYSDTK